MTDQPATSERPHLRGKFLVSSQRNTVPATLWGFPEDAPQGASLPAASADVAVALHQAPGTLQVSTHFDESGVSARDQPSSVRHLSRVSGVTLLKNTRVRRKKTKTRELYTQATRVTRSSCHFRPATNATGARIHGHLPSSRKLGAFDSDKEFVICPSTP